MTVMCPQGISFNKNPIKQSNKSGRSAGYVTGVCLSEAAKVHKGIISSYT